MTDSRLATEFNFDGLIGPTHNYAGLSPGNLASQAHKATESRPRDAALQGLAKMRKLATLGIPQAIIPPQPRPDLELLRRLGFHGNDAAVAAAAYQDTPHLLAAASSASSMWTANAATVCPSADSSDGRVHFTPANLVTSLHRANETSTTAGLLKAVFADESRFVHHPALPCSTDMGDEGAANHTRFAGNFADSGVQLFVYGHGGSADATRPRRHPARQTLQASQTIARMHGLDPDRTVMARQTAEAIDAGVFHNDVIAVGHRMLLFCHELAYVDSASVYAALRKATQDAIRIVEVKQQQVSLDQAVATYLFNSQIVTTPEDTTVLVAPRQCHEQAEVRSLLASLVDEGVFGQVEFVDLGQSMNNGGGPACLRLRVVLTPPEVQAVSQGVLWTELLAGQIEQWVNRHYRETLRQDDLADRMLHEECLTALDELTRILGLGSVYSFQQT
ncbi:MAG: N-succinylarginine dihydrolase [Planctomycetota bacterium]